MRTFYILGVDNLEGKYFVPKDLDLIEVQADTVDEAVRLASKQSNKRYFCSLKLHPLIEDTQKQRDFK